MKLSLDQRTDLALRAVRQLHAHGTRVRGRELAPPLDTTTQYLPQVLRPLVRAGWIESTPGPTGGYRLVVDPGEVSVLALIELMEGPTTPAPCVLRGGPCGTQDSCALHDPWQAAREALLAELAATPVAGPGGVRTPATRGGIPWEHHERPDSS